MGYMAKRPGAEQRGEHGLFTDSDAPIALNAVANEVAEHPGYVWTHVISLRREDAVRLGYTNSDMWRDLVKRHIDDISKAQNIPLANMKWYAAFHDTTHHPHIHLIVYSSDPRQGYLTKEGMAAIRSAFANDIFHEDMKSIYQAQTLTRDELKALSENNMKEIVARLGNGEVDERLVISIQKLYEQLKTADEMNPQMSNTDVAIVIGANDVVNPSALDDESSPLYGMPIINAFEARTVFVLKRGKGTGFSGVENPLFTNDNTVMIYGDAKQTVSSLVSEFDEG